MTEATYVSLKGFSSVNDSLFSTCYEINLCEWLKWGLLGKGGYFNINNSSSGAYSPTAPLSQLRYVADSRYSSGQVWETYRAPLVWESGIEQSVQPIAISGITVNNTFLPRSTTGASGYTIDYNLGRVIFPTGISTTSTVSMNYSHYWANVFTSRNAPWLQRAFAWASRTDHDHYSTQSGHHSFFRDNRIELPSVIVEVIPRYDATKGECLGGGRYVRQDFFFHIWAENSWERNQLKDIILLQEGKLIYLFDINNMERSGLLPLNSNCDIRYGATTYPTWVAPPTQSGSFRYRCSYLENLNSVEILSPQEGLWTATVRGSLMVEVPNI